MELLELNSKGNLVRLWQAFIGVKVDGDFGKATNDATIAWQMQNNLRADGKVGQNTLAVAKSQGFKLPVTATPERIKQITGTPSPKLIRVNVKAPQPFLNAKVVPSFNGMRAETFEKSGIDFLAVVGDMWRPASLRSNKDGVAFYSYHKTGRAIDVDQDSKALVIVSEPSNGKQYFRVYLICARQDGSLGTSRTLKDYRGYNVSKYVVDFTAIAEKWGWRRIPAHRGWQYKYNRREWWHYQKDEGLSWAEAMKEIQ